MPDALMLWTVAVFAVSGLMYVWMSRTASATSTTLQRAANRPGWIARRRARGGVKHRGDPVTVGYRSATSVVHLTNRSLPAMD